MILGESLALVCLGIVVGAAGAMRRASDRDDALRSCRPRIRPRYGTVAIVLMAIARCLAPACGRASRIDPLVALKAE